MIPLDVDATIQELGMSLDQFCALIGKSRWTVRRYRIEGEVPPSVWRIVALVKMHREKYKNREF